MKYNRF